MTFPSEEAVELAAHLTRRHKGTDSIAAVCRAALRTPYSVGLALASDAALAGRVSLCWDGPLADDGETLQVNLGEGPCVQALQRHGPVHADDLSLSPPTQAWPLFAHEARSRGIRAAFALPAPFPATTGPGPGGVGGLVLSLYRDRPGPLSLADQHTATTHLSAALLLLRMTVAATPEDEHPSLIPLSQLHAVIHQASGMISYRHGIPVDQALDRLRAHALSHAVDLTDLAHAVVHEGRSIPE
ncbi:ANTAR domain-containing protein [Streptomyces sp. NPDC016845]|uniref:ANTAR domain-containing protein n=1 Tax=Streptomyces sp. NPDC016845 TaxID=3364972 RepID=UPI0037A3AA5D